MTPHMIQDQIALEKLQKFLQANKLPASDIRLDGNIFIGYHDEFGNLVGSGGLELFGNVALLRSVAVDAELRSKSFGKKIVEDLLIKAKNLNIQKVYLLTETAHDFFEKKGFQDIARDQVPQPVQLSSEFAEVCPASANCMMHQLI